MNAIKNIQETARNFAFPIAVIGLSFATFLVFAELDAFEYVYEISREYEDWELDELFSFLIIATAALPIILVHSNRKLKEALRAKEEAERTLTERTRLLEIAVEDLEQFAYVASHDLKEPLRKIEAFGSRLESRCADDLDATAKNYLSRMRSGSARLQKLINDLLDFSKLSDTAEHAFKVIDLNKVVSAVESDLQFMIKEKDARIERDKLPKIHGEPTLIRQMIQNLISNALKFSQPDTPPVVTISAVETTDGLELRVRDNGIGFEQGNAEQIFQLFARLNGRGHFDGTGIGLATVKRIADHHNASVHAEGEPGQGASFTVSFPSQTADQKSAA